MILMVNFIVSMDPYLSAGKQHSEQAHSQNTRIKVAVCYTLL